MVAFPVPMHFPRRGNGWLIFIAILILLRNSSGINEAHFGCVRAFPKRISRGVRGSWKIRPILNLSAPTWGLWTESKQKKEKGGWLPVSPFLSSDPLRCEWATLFTLLPPSFVLPWSRPTLELPATYLPHDDGLSPLKGQNKSFPLITFCQVFGHTHKKMNKYRRGQIQQRCWGSC